MNIISYGAGVDSTALVILAAKGIIDLKRFRVVYADPYDDTPATINFLFDKMYPWLYKYGKFIHIVGRSEGVYGRWLRLKVTGSRKIRSCSQYSKIVPVNRFKRQFEKDWNAKAVICIGFNADEAGKRKQRPNRRYPLIENNVTRADCIDIIKAEGLPVPPKSGCWCCPFARVAEILAIARNPEQRDKILELERLANLHHPRKDGGLRTHFHNKPFTYWIDRAEKEKPKCRP